MKRILIAALLSVAVHWLLLGTSFIKVKTDFRTKPKPITIQLALTYKTAPKKTAAIPKRPLPPPVKPKPPQPIPEQPKPVIQKTVTPPPPKPVKMPLHPQPTPAAKRMVSKIEPVPETPRPPRPSDTLPVEKVQIISAPRIPAPVAAPADPVPLPPAPVIEARPKYDKNPKPSYPWVALKKGYEGTVILKVLVSKQGKVKDLKMLTSSGYRLLDQSAKDTVRHWLFMPAMRGNEMIEKWVKVPVRFELKDPS